MPQILLSWYSNVPLMTRIHSTGLLLTHFCVQFGFINKYHLYFDPALVMNKHQYWRIITAFLFYDEYIEGIDFEFFIHFYMIIFCYYLERDWFLGRTNDFILSYALSAASLIAVSTLYTVPFLGAELHLVYFQIWLLHSTHRSGIRSLIVLSWVIWLMFFSMSYQFSSYGRIFALALGALYHFLEDILPTWHISRGVRLLRTPANFILNI